MDQESKRDLLYSLLSLAFSASLFIVYGQYLENLVKLESVFQSVAAYVCLVEIAKVLLVTYFYPTPYTFDETNGGALTGNSKGSRLPFSKRDQFQGTSSNVKLSNQQRLHRVGKKITELLKGFPNFVAAVGVGHVMFVLFGAAVFEKWRLTVEFSVVLTAWLYFALTLDIHPAVVLQELMYISSWRDNKSSLWRAKWRFLLTLFGAWVGTVVIPLDWDRPWQQWPIPCIVSSFLSTVIVNLVYSAFLLIQLVQNGPTCGGGDERVGATTDLTSPKSPTKYKSKYF